MKKTLITLFAAAGLVMNTSADSLTLPEAWEMLDAVSVSVTGSHEIDFDQPYVTMSLVLDTDAFKTLWSTVSSSNRPVIATFTDASSHVYGAQLGETSTANCFLLTTHHPNTGDGNRGGWTQVSGYDWNTVESAVLTMSSYNNTSDATGGTRLTFSFLLEGDDTVHTFTKNDGGLRYQNGGSIVAATYDPTLVKEAYIFNALYDGANAVTLNTGILTAPEPATATLSLLALAGLCARRRR